MATDQSRWFDRLTDTDPIIESLTWTTGLFVATMLLVQLLAVWLTIELHGVLQLAIDNGNRTTDPRFAGWIVAVVFVESAILLGVVLAYNRLSDRWKRLLKRAFLISFIVGSHALLYAIAGLYLTILFGVLWAVGYGIMYVLLNHLNLELLLRNGFWLGFFITVSVYLGTIIGIAPALLFLVAILAVDYVEVRTGWMGLLISKFSSVGFTPAIIFANELRPDMDELDLSADSADEFPEWFIGLLGGGDLVIPTMFLVSALLVFDSRLPALGIMLGSVIGLVMVIVGSQAGDSGDIHPAMTYISPCVVAGYFTAGLLAGVPLVSLLGVG